MPMHVLIVVLWSIGWANQLYRKPVEQHRIPTVNARHRKKLRHPQAIPNVFQPVIIHARIWIKHRLSTVKVNVCPAVLVQRIPTTMWNLVHAFVLNNVHVTICQPKRTFNRDRISSVHVPTVLVRVVHSSAKIRIVSQQWRVLAIKSIPTMRAPVRERVIMLSATPIATTTRQVAHVHQIMFWRTMVSLVYRSAPVPAVSTNIPMQLVKSFVNLATTALVPVVFGLALNCNAMAPVLHQVIRITLPSMVYDIHSKEVANITWRKIKTTHSPSWPKMSLVVPPVSLVRRTSLSTIVVPASICNVVVMSFSMASNWIIINLCQKSTDKCRCSKVVFSQSSQRPIFWSNGTKQHGSI